MDINVHRVQGVAIRDVSTHDTFACRDLVIFTPSGKHTISLYGTKDANELSIREEIHRNTHECPCCGNPWDDRNPSGSSSETTKHGYHLVNCTSCYSGFIVTSEADDVVNE